VGLNGRLKRLEERASASKGWRSPRYLDAYFRALDEHERKEASLPPLPYTEEDRRESMPQPPFRSHHLPLVTTLAGLYALQAVTIIGDSSPLS
jgi:hypothetical protein